MRLEQFQGAVNEIRGHELVGKGFGWSSNYIKENGYHPVLLAFESLVFVVLCNSGIIGAFIWILFFLLLLRLNRKLISSEIDIYLLDTLVIVFVAYAIGTGEYGYIQFFAVFYTFLLSYLFTSQQVLYSESKNY